MNYINNPLKVYKLNKRSEVITTYILLNDSIPKKIISSISNCDFDGKVNTWNYTDSKVLEDFFGKQYLEKLNPTTGYNSFKSNLSDKFNIYSNLVFNAETTHTTGGAVKISFDSKTELLQTCSDFTNYPFLAAVYNGKKTVIGGAEKKKSNIIYEIMNIHDEDSVYDLKQKIFMITGIDMFRQHIFYNINGEKNNKSYIIYINGTQQSVVFSNMYNTSNRKLLGVPIDDYFYANKESITIINNDKITFMRMINNIYISDIYMLDLYDLTNPLEESEDLTLVINDKVKLELLYYGFIIKLFPQLTLIVYKNLMSNANVNYPNLIFTQNKIRKIYDKQNELIKIKDKYKTTDNINVSITYANIKVNSINSSTLVLVRNIVDLFRLDKEVIALSGRILIDSSSLLESNYKISNNIRYSTEFPVTVIKKHLSYFDLKTSVKNSKNETVINRTNLNIDNLLDKNLKYNSVNLFIYLDKIITINLSSDGSYNVYYKWEESDNIDYNSIKANIAPVVNGPIKKLNELKSLIFPIGGKYKTIDEFTDLNINNIDICFYWNNSITETQFKELKVKFAEYEHCDIVSIKGIHISGAYVVYFKKGITSKNEIMLKGLTNQYSYLSDEVDYEKWEDACKGATVKIYHRIMDVKIEILNVSNQYEFNIIKSFILSILNGIPKSTDKIIKSNKSKIKQLKELDPELYDLKKYNKKLPVYSVICQSEKQPVIYSKSEFSLIPKSKKITKYWNFTKNEENYYECPSATYNTLNFRTGIHPKGYCIPCCKKKSTISKTTENCLKYKIVNDDVIESKNYILSYGKPLQSGRISRMPEIIYNLLEDTNLFMIHALQSTRNMKYAGLLFSIARCIDEDYNVFIDDICGTIMTMSNYYVIGHGSCSIFDSAADLCGAIKNAFLGTSEIYSPLSTGSILSDKIWNDIIIHLTYITYNYVVVIFDNGEETTGPVNIIITPENLKNIEDPEVKLILLMKQNEFIYPIVKIYDTTFPELIEAIHEDYVKIIKTIFKITEDGTGLSKKNIDAFLSKNTDYKFLCQLSNVRGQGYGIVVKKDGIDLYIPSKYYIIDTNEKTVYGVRPKPTSKKIVDEFIAKFGIGIVNTFSDRYEVDDNLYFYFEVDEVGDYDHLDIDREIFAYLTKNKVEDQSKLKQIKYKNNLYDLFCIEFATLISKEKNVKMREKIFKLFKNIDISDSNIIKYIKTELIVLLPNEDDVQKLLSLIRLNINSVDNTYLKLKHAIEETKFDFDNLLLYNLDSKSFEEKVEILYKLMESRIMISSEIGELDNIYTARGDDKKLTIPNDKFNSYCNLLATDLENRDKKFLVHKITSGIIDSLNFTKYKNEILYMEL